LYIRIIKQFHQLRSTNPHNCNATKIAGTKQQVALFFFDIIFRVLKNTIFDELKKIVRLYSI